MLGVGELPFPPLLHIIAGQLKIPVEHWAEYGDRAQTRREHLVELQTIFGFASFTTAHHKLAVQELTGTHKRVTLTGISEHLSGQIGRPLTRVNDVLQSDLVGRIRRCITEREPRISQFAR